MAKENESGMGLIYIEISSDESSVEKSIDPLGSDEEAAVGS